MRAVVHDRYGGPEVLRVDEVERPVPAADEVLVAVRATSVNRTDLGFRTATPWIVRGWSGWRRPKYRVLGSEFAGEVVEIGADVDAFAVGDRVFGLSPDRFGTHAEYVAVRATGLIAAMPEGFDFHQLGAIGDGAMLALGCLRSGGVGPSTRVLIYGASGSIGTAGVQLAKHLGADVTAVCDTSRVELVRSLGADRVIDYSSEDFTADGGPYDVVFDAVGKTTFRRCRRVMSRRGRFVDTDFGPFVQVPLLVLATAVLRRRRRVLMPLPHFARADIELLGRLVADGDYRPVIDRCYPLHDAVEATRYVELGHKTGNVVLTVGDQPGRAMPR